VGFLVFPGIHEPVGKIPGHTMVDGIDRYLLLTKASVPGRTFHIAAHIVSGGYEAAAGWRFTQPQEHEFDEVNVLLPGEGGLRYKYEIDGTIHLVDGPCSVFISAGTRHRMEPVSGNGIFLCIQLEAGR
jgi:mannose-6-phosphate isomerase-like protein (cupin superfamily)